MNDILIRQAEISDIEAMSRVVAQSWEATYKNLISREDMRFFTNPARRKEMLEKRLVNGDLIYTLLLNGEVSGVCSAKEYENAEFPHTAEIDQLYLSPQSVGRGLGGKLLEHMLKSLKSKGYKQAVLFTMEGNEKATGFYYHLGFKPDGFYLICENLSRKNRALRYVKEL